MLHLTARIQIRIFLIPKFRPGPAGMNHNDYLRLHLGKSSNDGYLLLTGISAMSLQSNPFAVLSRHLLWPKSEVFT
jgi:hypothetical protein